MSRTGSIDIGLSITADAGDAADELGTVSSELDTMAKQMDELEDASDDAGDELKKAAKDADTFRKQLKRARDGAGTFGKSVKSAMEVARKGVDLARKAFALFRIAMSATVGQALQFRKAGDGMVKTLTDAARSVRLLGARVGDVLLPVLVGLAKAFAPLAKAAQAYLKENQRLIAQDIVTTFVDVGRVLVDLLSPALLAAGNIVAGLSLTWDALQFAVNKSVALQLKAIGTMVDVGRRSMITLSLGIETPVTDALAEASAALNDFGDVFDESAAANVAAMEKTTSSLDKFEQGLEDAEEAADEFLNRVYIEGQKTAATSTIGTTKTIEEQAKALERLKAQEEAFATRRQALADLVTAKWLESGKVREESIKAGLAREQRLFQVRKEQAERLQDLRKELADEMSQIREKQADEEEARLEKQAQAMEALAVNVGSRLAGAFEDAVASTKSFRDALDEANETGLEGQEAIAEATKNTVSATEALETAFTQMAEQMLQDLARIAAQKAFEAIIGFALGGLTGGAGVGGGLLAGLFGGLFSGAASGGIVVGGTRGRDTVPALLGKDEIVLPPDVADIFRGIREGGQPAAAGGGGAVALTFNFPTMIAPDADRMKRDINEKITPVVLEALAGR